MKELRKYDTNLPSCFQVRKKDRQIYAFKKINKQELRSIEIVEKVELKVEKKNASHGNNFCHIFMKVHTIKFFIGINMLYKFGKDRSIIVAVRLL